MDDFLRFLGLSIIAGVIVFIVYLKNKKKKESAKQKEIERIIAEEEKQQEMEALKLKWEENKAMIAANGLPTIDSENLILTNNEICHFKGEAFLCKLKQQTVGYEGGSQGVSFRVVNGVHIRVGNYKGHYVKEDIIEKNDGLIYLTSKKVLFTALTNSCTIKYKEIVSLCTVDDMLQIQTEKRTYLFLIKDFFNFLGILEYIINKYEEENNS